MKRRNRPQQSHSKLQPKGLILVSAQNVEAINYRPFTALATKVLATQMLVAGAACLVRSVYYAVSAEVVKSRSIHTECV